MTEDLSDFTLPSLSGHKYNNTIHYEPYLSLKINYHGNNFRLEKTEKGDWIDLYTEQDEHLFAGERKYISLGVSIELPEGYEAVIAPRSSTFKRYGILQSNSIGVIDNSYCGDDDIWAFPAYATREITIPAGSRICQFRIQQKQPQFKFITVDSLGNENRGGFGKGTAYLDK